VFFKVFTAQLPLLHIAYSSSVIQDLPMTRHRHLLQTFNVGEEQKTAVGRR
jgi:hypothetical protein